MTTRTISRTAKTPDELSQYQRRRRLVLGLLCALIFVALFFVRSESGNGKLHEHVEAIGICLMMVAIVGRTWSTLYIGGRKASEIVRGGPYSVTRNPLYVFSTIGAAGIGAMTGSIVVAIAFALLCYAAFLSVIQVEETYLENVFGEPYRRYRREVPRFFPDFRLFAESDMISVRPQVIYRTFGDGLVFLAAYPFFETVEHFQNIGVLPVLLRLY